MLFSQFVNKKIKQETNKNKNKTNKINKKVTIRKVIQNLLLGSRPTVRRGNVDIIHLLLLYIHIIIIKLCQREGTKTKLVPRK